MNYSITQIEAIKEALAGLPEKESKQRMSKLEAVRVLRGEIAALQARGYELSEIAESLKSNGLAISTATLKNYLQRTAERAGAKKAAKTKPASSKQARRPTPASSGGAVESTAGSTPAAKSGTFIPRGDSDEI